MALSESVNHLVQDIRDSSLMNHQDFRNVSALSDCYDNTLRSLLDQYAPVKKRIITVRPAAPWYCDNIKQKKAERRKLERRWRSTKLTIDRKLYTEQCKRVNQLIHESKMKFYSDVINENTNNQRLLYGKVNPTVLIGSLLVGISPYGPFPWKRS